MSPDFWAGYISGAAGILIGNPLDLIKVRIQAGNASSPASYWSQFSSAQSLIRGATAPILGYGALNALLFVTYNRTSDFLTPPMSIPSLWTAWIAGAAGGLATFIVSTPTELVKCRAQMSSSPAAASSWGITRQILRTEGIRGLYLGGVITALRDSIGYGFYFWSYEISTRFLSSKLVDRGGSTEEAAKVLVCGGIAGVATWASIFPLDVIKTRVQTQALENERVPLLHRVASVRKLSAIEIARNTYRVDGVGAFSKGLGICSTRAFIVNAAQWAVYEYIMRELDPTRKPAGNERVK